MHQTSVINILNIIRDFAKVSFAGNCKISRVGFLPVKQIAQNIIPRLGTYLHFLQIIQTICFVINIANMKVHHLA